MTRPGAFAATLLFAVAGPLNGQHVEVPTEIDPEIGNCSLCHTAHPSTQAPYLLKIDPNASSIIQTPGLGARSESCLRCHWTTALRDQQPEFIATANPVGGYLGPSLDNDHPLGDYNSGAAPSILTTSPESLGGTFTPLTAAPNLADGIGCVDCHEPHAPGPNIIPDPVEQLIVCTVCHAAEMPSPENHSALACTECHQLHGSADGHLLKDPSTNPVCLSCHVTVPQFSVSPSSSVSRW
jgi:predicted CXXCH cytochrome family protein